jgi:hypothetical protein
LTMELDANNITGENWDANNAGEDWTYYVYILPLLVAVSFYAFNTFTYSLSRRSVSFSSAFIYKQLVY